MSAFAGVVGKAMAKHHISLRDVVRAALLVTPCFFASLSYAVKVLFGPRLASLFASSWLGAASYWMLRFGHATLGVGPVPSQPDLRIPDGSLSDSSRRVRFVCISDTHNKHQDVRLPPGDVLLHAGDFTLHGTPGEVKDFNDWLGSLPHKHKVVVGGNHDLTFDEDWYAANAEDWLQKTGEAEKANCSDVQRLLSNCTYLRDELLEVEGVPIYATPVQPCIPGKRWAFNAEEPERRRAFAKIPEGTRVLLTHTPPLNQGDRIVSGMRVGCAALADAIYRVRPSFCVFGHVHEGYGVTQDDISTYINASSCSMLYTADHAPIVFDVLVPA